MSIDVINLHVSFNAIVVPHGTALLVLPKIDVFWLTPLVLIVLPGLKCTTVTL